MSIGYYFNRICPSGYLERLSQLIQKRLAPGADKGAIDSQIWDLFGETWAVMFTDLSGFSRLVSDFGIIHFLQIVYEAQRLFSPCIDQYNGILIKMEGDSMLVLFRQPSNAVQCAVAMQRAAKAYNEDKIDAEKILVCVGIGYGRILTIGEHDVFGAEVNAACKLGEDIAKSWEILVTDAVADQLHLSDLSFDQLEGAPPGASAAFKVLYSL
jgi:class 3 adenylate cyclase